MKRSLSAAKNILLLVVSLFASYAVAEFAYRLHLFHKSIFSFSVANKAIHEYDASSGYRFVPNTKAITATFYKGVPAFYETLSVGPYANLGDGVKSWNDDDFKILAFGDSFTAYPYSYNSWTDFIVEPLSSDVTRNVQVMNLGRDGFGLLQMVRLANTTVRAMKADLVIIAFIPGDLGRARIWRTNLNINGKERELVTTEESATPDMHRAADVLLIEPRINLAWCKRVFEEVRHDDPLVEALHTQCESVLAENLRTDPSDICVPFLYNRIRYGDPFTSIRKVQRNPWTDMEGFEEDDEFVQDLKSLLSSNVPVVFVLLPDYGDLIAGEIELNRQGQLLYESLCTRAPGKVVNVLDYNETPNQSVESLFLLPYDHHPSKLGAQWYANAIVKAIRKRWNLNKLVQNDRRIRQRNPAERDPIAKP